MFTKRLVSVVVICLAISLSLQQTPTTEISKACSTGSNDAPSNILTWLKSKSIDLYEKSALEKDTKICVGDFDVFGTCCKGASVKTYIDKQNDALIAKWKAYITALSPIKNKMSAALKRLSNKMSSKDLESKKALLSKDNNNAASKFKTAFNMLPSNAAQITTLKTFLQDFDTNGIKSFKEQGAKCYDALKVVRANSICALCSTNNALYTKTATTNQIKFKTTIETCSSIVNTCYPIWRFNWLLTTSIQYVLVLRNKGKADKAEYTLNNSVSMTDATMKNLAATFQFCSIDAATSKLSCPVTTLNTVSTEDHIKRLCNEALVLNKENGAIEGDSSLGSVDPTEVGKAADEDAEGDKNKDETVARLLQVLPATEADVGIEIDSSGTYNTLTSTTSGVVPTASVDTSKAGDENTSFATKVAASLLGLFATLVVLA
jgi:hypothetical protein